MLVLSPKREIDPLVNTDCVLHLVSLPNNGAIILVSRYEQFIHPFSYINLSIRVRILFKATCKVYAGAMLQSIIDQGFVITNQSIVKQK